MSKRTFANLRRPTRTPDKEIATVESAIAKIAMQPEGVVWLNWLRNRTTFRIVPADSSIGALQGSAAERQLMSEIENQIINGGREKRSRE